ncbi:MAG: geranylgeranylglycerol-phosphate geranylgeranyltransferase [Promethearchaeota archaeon]
MNEETGENEGSSGSRNVKAYCEILRPVNCVFGGLTIVIGMLNFQDVPAASLVFSDIRMISLLLLGFLVYFITAGASNTINDYFDYEIDLINRPSRPLSRGAISRKTALNYYIILCLISFSLSLFVGLYTPNPAWIPFFNVIFQLVGFLYAWKGKPSGFPGNIMVGIAFSFGIPFGAMFITPITLIPQKIWFFFTTSTLLLVSRELVKGMEDMEGDRKFNIKTVANIKGEKTTAILSIIFSTCAILSFTSPAFFLIKSTWFTVIMLLGDVSVVASMLFLAIDYKSKKKQKYASLMLKIGAFLGLIAYVIASI